MVICLERDADLHMAQLMPLPLTVSCFRKIQIGCTFLVPPHRGSPGPLNRCVCVGACVCVRACVCVCKAINISILLLEGGSVAEWLVCWTQVQIGVATLPGNSLRQTVHTHRASVHQAAKLVAALLRGARVTAGRAESYGNLPPGL